MNVRELVQHLQAVADAHTTDYAAYMSMDTAALLSELKGISIDITLNVEAQQLQLLSDIQTYIAHHNEMAAKLQAQLPAGRQVTDPALFLVTPENQHPQFSKENNVDLRNSVSAHVTAAMINYTNQYIQGEKSHVDFANINPLIDQVKTQLTHSFDPNALNDPNNFRHKSRANYDNIKILGSADSAGKFSHETAKVQKAVQGGEVHRSKHDKAHFAKYCANKTDAGRELIAGEAYRFVLNSQPKTRLAKNDKNETFIVSTEVPDSISLQGIPSNEIRAGLDTGMLKGLGGITVMNLFLEETDAKWGNMFVDKSGNLIKIDGDWCFSSIRDKASFGQSCPITAGDLASLPLVHSFEPYNWLDQHLGRIPNINYAIAPDKTAISDTLSNDPAFRLEVNQTLLKLLIMPKPLLGHFVKGYINDKEEIKLLTDHLAERSALMRNAALHNASFRQYLASPAAKEHCAQCISDINSFTTTGKHQLVNDTEKSTERLAKQFFNLQKECLQITAALPRGKVLPPPLPAGYAKPAPATNIQPPPIDPNAVVKRHP